MSRAPERPGLRVLEEELEKMSDEDLLRDESVLEVVLSRRVYRLRTPLGTLYVYRTGREDYLVVPRTMCTCPDFMINVVSRRRRASCIHLRAVEYIERRGVFCEDLVVRDWREAVYRILATGSLGTTS